MLTLDAAAVHAALPWPALADALALAFQRGQATTPVRHAHALSATDTLLLMPAWDPQLLVVKLVTVMPAAAHTVQASVLALDRASGRPLAVLDGEALTLRRTAATSALAARHLARPDTQRLLLVGAGRLAGWMARAHAALRPGLREIHLWARRPAQAAALAAELAAELVRDNTAPALTVAVADPDLASACAQAELICCATTATEPVLRGEWLQPGTHLDLVGAFKPSMREVDEAAVQRSQVVVDTLAGAAAEAGDLAQALACGAITPGHVQGELAQLLRGEIPGRRAPTDITLFKSVGTALEDLVAAALVLQAHRGGEANSAPIDA